MPKPDVTATSATAADDLPEVRGLLVQPAETIPFVEQTFTSPLVLDERTLAIGPLRLRLADVDAINDQELCKLPSGRPERCAERAKRQLELQVRWRSLQCRYQLQTPTFGIGACKVGDLDLAERLRAGRPTWHIRFKDGQGSKAAQALPVEADQPPRPGMARLDLIAAPVPAESFTR